MYAIVLVVLWFLGPALVFAPLTQLLCHGLFTVWRRRSNASFTAAWYVLSFALFATAIYYAYQFITAPPRAHRSYGGPHYDQWEWLFRGPFLSGLLGSILGLIIALFRNPPLPAPGTNSERRDNSVQIQILFVAGLLIGIAALVLFVISGLR